MIMSRDSRLLVSLLLFIISAIFCAVQFWIVYLYAESAISGNWTHFAALFSVEAPPSGPDKFCFDRCAADLPLFSGYVASFCFVVGLIVLIHAWLRPKAVQSVELVGTK